MSVSESVISSHSQHLDRRRVDFGDEEETGGVWEDWILGSRAGHRSVWVAQVPEGTVDKDHDVPGGRVRVYWVGGRAGEVPVLSSCHSDTKDPGTVTDVRIVPGGPWEVGVRGGREGCLRRENINQ